MGVEPTGFHRKVSATYLAFPLPRLSLARALQDHDRAALNGVPRRNHPAIRVSQPTGHGMARDRATLWNTVETSVSEELANWRAYRERQQQAALSKSNDRVENRRRHTARRLRHRRSAIETMAGRYREISHAIRIRCIDPLSGVNWCCRSRLSFLPVFGPHHWSTIGQPDVEGVRSSLLL